MPQFHEIEENNQWWGKGFTEWSNTRQSIARFDGHYQPRIPHSSIGYYDLSQAQTIEKQARLARLANIDGFCFYYYWFSGKQLLETPIEHLYRHPDIDIEYVICWANENWTRTWDGLDNHILIGQHYQPGWEIAFIQDVSKYFADPRYVRINGRPVLIIYKLLDIPNHGSIISAWRAWCRDHGMGEISIWAVYDIAFAQVDVSQIDKFIEFPPRKIGALEKLDGSFLNPKTTDFHLYDYKALVASILQGSAQADNLDFTIYRTAMMGWDNAARRKDGFSVWVNYSRDDFYSWCRHIWQYTVERHPHGERFIFINAWNEWAEGTYLEPDERFGYSNLNVLSRAMTNLPREQSPLIFTGKSPDSPISAKPNQTRQNDWRLIVHIHLYHLDTLDHLRSYLLNVHHPFDLYVTIAAPQARNMVTKILGEIEMVQQLRIIHVPNIGRDLGPFLVELADVIHQYDLVIHLHGKHSSTVWWGHLWRDYLLDHCLGSRRYVDFILQTFASNGQLGLLSPPIYPPLKAHCNWGGDAQKEWCQEMLDIAMSQYGEVQQLPETPYFAAGSFFWARVEALKPLFQLNLTYRDFERERFTTDYRLEHVIERVCPYIVSAHRFGHLTSLHQDPTAPIPTQKKRRLCIYVGYSQTTVISQEDLYYLRSLSVYVETLVIVSNSPIHDDQIDEVTSLCSRLIIRSNRGFDFGAWRDALVEIGTEEMARYDEVILTNSSCIGPFVPWAKVFASMSKKSCDFWGLTIFPETPDCNRPEAQALPNRTIPRHVQSFFMVFDKRVTTSSAFQGFWLSVGDAGDLLSAVVRYETQLTVLLESYGFRYSAYCQGHEAMQSHNQDRNYNAIYNQPYEMLILGSPLIKNKFAAMWPGQIPLIKEYIAQTGCYPLALASRWQ